ncbi:hypothetical protein HanRHA438_Chr10g0474731 [Helianthus annuus]|nr:hypothetical protein HanIR_Chr10g0498131 [Helianthus annuus]KAJ0881479.1 hypothetical protein HanRHA438_Chr10g0474731 [Helianthus annuus]
MAIFTSRLAALRFLVRIRIQTLYKCTFIRKSGVEINDSSVWIFERSFDGLVLISIIRFSSVSSDGVRDNGLSGPFVLTV